MTVTTEPFRSFFDQSPDAMLLARSGRLVSANAAAVRLLGASRPEEVIELPLLDLFASDAHASIGVHLPEGMRTTPAPRLDARVVRLDGQMRDVEVSSAWLPGADAVHLTLRDITDRKAVESRLRESEERLRLALAGAQEGVWDWDLETNAVVYSARWKAMLGYEEHEIEPHVSAWERLLHPNDSVDALQAVGGLSLGHDTYRVECRLRHKDGHYVHVLSRGFPMRRASDGRVIRIVGTHFDLTEQKSAEAALRESEERLTLAFAGAQEGVWDWNLATGAVVYSKRWKEMLGYEDHEIEPHVSAWERLLHPDDRTRAQEVNLSVFAGHPAYEVELRLRHKKGHFVPVLSRGLPIQDADGSVVRIVGTHLDLTERKRVEEIQERERAERTRTELLSRLVFAQEDERRRIAREMHDQFGEHLSALSRRIEVLRDISRDRPELTDQVDALEIVAQRLDRDVDYLVWELRPTALDDLGLRAALSNYVKDWSNRVGIPVNLHTSGLLDDRLRSEVETTLYRIAQEALTNVARHARASHVEIILERRADDTVVLAVEDDGVGFDAGEERTQAGHGFGLLGMQERAALVGATLQIESSVGQGTTVLLRMTANVTNQATHG